MINAFVERFGSYYPLPKSSVIIPCGPVGVIAVERRCTPCRLPAHGEARYEQREGSLEFGMDFGWNATSPCPCDEDVHGDWTAPPPAVMKRNEDGTKGTGTRRDEFGPRFVQGSDGRAGPCDPVEKY